MNMENISFNDKRVKKEVQFCFVLCIVLPLCPGLLRAVSSAVDLIMAHFGSSRDPEEKV